METNINVPPDKGHYIAGFVDGEGSFYISARRRKDYTSQWRFELHFNVSNTDITVLQICKKYLGCGQIRQSRSGFYTLEVEKRKSLKNFIIPFFRKFGFLSNKKKKEFQIFRQAFNLLENKIETQQDLKKFLALRAQLNELRTARILNTDAIILETFVFVEKSSETIR